MEGQAWDPHTTLPILRSVLPDCRPADAADAYEQLRAFILASTPETLRAVDLGLMPPSKGLHFMLGPDGLYYDFVNTDRVLTELQRAGAALSGSVLDFGCSTGRNVAVLARSGLPLQLTGVDPVPSSIEWANDNIAGAQFVLSRQAPPLPFSDQTFDLIYAKSIWTHFSPDAARQWFAEIARLLKRGGHFFFNIHGAHDLANRLAHNFPAPRYANIAHGEFADRASFVGAAFDGIVNHGWFFRPYTSAASQADLGKLPGAVIDDWGVMFMTPEYLREKLLPASLELVRYTPAATAGRLDGCVVRRVR